MSLIQQCWGGSPSRLMGLCITVFLCGQMGCGSETFGANSDDVTELDAGGSSQGNLVRETSTDAMQADSIETVEATQGADGFSGDGEGVGPEFVLPASGTHVVVDSEAGLILSHDGEIRLTLPIDAFELGVVPEIESDLNYDPYYFEEDVEFSELFQAPDGLVWMQAQSLTIEEDSDAQSIVTLHYADERTAQLSIDKGDLGRFSILWTASSDAEPAVYFRLRALVDEQEGFYGMGEVFDQVEHRGKVRPMQFEPSTLESGYNEVHAPVSFLIGSTGWGLFVESMRPGVFAVANEAPDLLKVTYGLGEAWKNGLRFHLLAASHPLDVTRLYYVITAFPGSIRSWALGPWLWRDEVEDQAAVQADLQQIRDLGLAVTGYWIDRPYASDVNSFDFKAEDYPDPQAMFQLAADLGIKMALWHTPYVDPDGDLSGQLYLDALENGYFAPTMSTAVAKWGPPIDFTNPEAFLWWQGLLGDYIDLGVVGFKLDYGEEVIVGAFGNRLPWLFFDGSDELDMHRGFFLLYHQLYAELLPQDGGFLLCRSGTYGDQVSGVIIWPGDIDSTMSEHGQEVIEDNGDAYISVGGLPAAVIAGSSLGPSGFPFFASDTGGYRHSPPDRETYVRWFQHTALTPVMQAGTNTNDLPWEFGPDKVYDEEMLGWFSDYASLHLRLFPYLWTYVERLQTEGRAIQRPLGLAYPDLGVHPSYTYLLGDHLLVAPVVKAGLVARSVMLPPGQWLNWWTGERLDGVQEVMVDAPLERIPLFVQAGAMIVMLRPEIETLNSVADPEAVKSLEDAENPLQAVVSQGPESSFSLYDGTILTQRPINSGFRLERVSGSVFGGRMAFEAIGVMQAPLTVQTMAGDALTEVDSQAALQEGSNLWFHHQDRGGTLLIILDEAEAGVDVVVP